MKSDSDTPVTLNPCLPDVLYFLHHLSKVDHFKFVINLWNLSSTTGRLYPKKRLKNLRYPGPCIIPPGTSVFVENNNLMRPWSSRPVPEVLSRVLNGVDKCIVFAVTHETIKLTQSQATVYY